MSQPIIDAVAMGQHVVGGPVIGVAAVGLMFGVEPSAGFGAFI